jgi:hypothetical protein
MQNFLGAGIGLANYLFGMTLAGLIYTEDELLEMVIGTFTLIFLNEIALGNFYLLD